MGYVEAACAVCVGQSDCDDFPPETKQRNQLSRKFSIHAGKEDTYRGRQKNLCSACSCSHSLEKCLKFTRLTLEEKWKLVRDKRLCFSCLLTGHPTKDCPSKQICNINGCKFPHHKLLHGQTQNFTRSNSDYRPETVTHSNENFADGQVLLRILAVELKGTKGTIKTYAMCDEGSTITLVDCSLAKKVGFAGRTDSLSFTGVCGVNKTVPAKRATFKICGMNDTASFNMTARIVPDLDLPTQFISCNRLKAYEKRCQNPLTWEYGHVKPMILIGQDNYDLMVPHQVLKIPCHPTITRSDLGWSLCGKTDSSGSQNHFMRHVSVDSSDENLDKLVRESFQLESIGVNPHTVSKYSMEEQKAIEILDKTSRRVGDRWEVGLPWRDENRLPPSKGMAFSRLKSIEKKMDSEPSFAQFYCSKIQEYLDKGYAVKLTNAVDYPSPKTWYLPHFGVTNVNKPNKLRLVFDGAAKVRGKSLNDFLITGPDLLKPLTSVLAKFRQHKIAFSGDIREMFHQVTVREEDRCSQRFLRRGMRRDIEPEIYQMNAMIFGASSSPFIAQYIKNKNALDFQGDFTEAVNGVLECHYMDDLLDSRNTKEEAIHYIQDMIEVHRRGGFEIRNWTCSSRDVLEKIPKSLRSIDDNDLQKTTDLPVERVLGMSWDPNSDCFKFNVKFSKCDPAVLTCSKLPTKRDVLKIAMSVFDPLGLLCHFTIVVRILMQDLWKENLHWDDPIPVKYKNRWQSWVQQLEEVKTVQIPRCYSPNGLTKDDVQLHLFCDSSSKAYAVAAYFRSEVDGKVTVSFVAAKSRVAPNKLVSIPRLELQAAVMASRLSKTIKDEHTISIPSTFLWSDSKIVLTWIKSETHQFRQYVAHRVEEIHELTQTHEWRHIPTKLNVSDDATRDEKKPDLSSGSRWFLGPDFLLQLEMKWPNENITASNNPNDVELKKVFINHMRAEHWVLPNPENYSSWRRLIRVTGWIIFFVRRLKKLPTSASMGMKEIKQAETLWIKKSQRDSFSHEIHDLQKNKSVDSTSKLKCLSPYLDSNEIIRIRGRIDRATNVTDDTKRPMILDPNHPVARLIIDQYHHDALHQGQEYVVNELRQKYWILRVRVAVRSSWARCRVCQQRRAIPSEIEMSPLPECRLQSRVRPFTFTGLDFFGPLTVTVGRHHEKRYGALFTCMTTRAIHIEVSHFLSTDSTLMAIMRMISRRGKPLEIFSDNGTNFQGCNNELKIGIKNLNHNKIHDEMTVQEIKWNFNPPAAPHMGGSWERLVRSVKTALSVILKERAPKDETLTTLITEVEGILNSRPLTHVPLDSTDDHAITPNHFLLGTSSLVNPYDLIEDRDLCLRKQWRIAQRLADTFWTRWLKEYLPTLTRRTKWWKSTPEIKPGDVVTVADPNLPRNTWPKGLIVQTYKGKDGRTRVADVKTSQATYRRPISRLCLLDVTTVAPGEC